MHLIIIGAYFSFIIWIVAFIHRKGVGWIGKLFLTLFFVLIPLCDMYVAKGIMWNYARQNSPLQEITREIEKPESVLWIDNVWPGFDEYGRHWMVEKYLDGEHLNTLVLLGDDGRYYLYHATLEDFPESEKVRLEHEKLTKNIDKLSQEAKLESRRGGDNKELWRKIRKELKPQLTSLGYRPMRDEEINKIFARPKIYQNLNDVSSINYRVELNRNRLPELQEKFVRCDEIIIEDLRQDTRIAFSKRCLGYSPWVGYNPIGPSSPFYGGVRLGDERIYEFDDEVLFGYAGVRVPQWSRNLFERGSYRRAAINWKSKQKNRGKLTDHGK